MTSTIIELRQAQATNVVSNGDYEVLLPFKEEINEGDQIVVSKAFIDTQSASEQRINIPDGGLTLSLQGYKYLMNQGDPGQADNADKSLLTDAGATALNADGTVQILCENVNPSADLRTLVSVKLLQTGKGLDPSGVASGTLLIKYTDHTGAVITQPSQEFLNGQNQEKTCRVGSWTYSVNPAAPQPLSVVWQPTGGDQAVNGALIEAINTSPADPPGVGFLLQPQMFTFSTLLPGGSYSQEELVTQLNDVLQRNDPGATEFVDAEGREFFDTYGQADNYFINLDGTSVSQFKDGTLRWVGASNVALDFIPTTNQFVWAYLHTPYYYQAREVMGYELNYPSDAANHHVVNRWAGFMLHSVNAYDSKGVSYPFWDKILGFPLASQGDNKSILVRPSGIATKTYGGDTYQMPTFEQSTEDTEPPEEGVNMTAGYVGLGSAINTGPADNANAFWYQGPDEPPNQLPYYNPVSATTKILGSQKGVLSNVNNGGYFLIEVDGGWLNSFYDTQRNNKNQKAIISRYYSQDSYTSGTASDSVVYQHVGPSMLLQNFKVRVLNPDKQVPDNLGAGTSVFLEIVKAPQMK